MSKSVSVATDRWGGPGRAQGTAAQIGTFWCHDWQSETCNTNSVWDKVLRNSAARRSVNAAAAVRSAGHLKTGVWGAHLLVDQPQGVFDVGILQGDGRSPLGEEQSEDQVNDAVKAASDQLWGQMNRVTQTSSHYQLPKPFFSPAGCCPTLFWNPKQKKWVRAPPAGPSQLPNSVQDNLTWAPKRRNDQIQRAGVFISKEYSRRWCRTAFSPNVKNCVVVWLCKQKQRREVQLRRWRNRRSEDSSRLSTHPVTYPENKSTVLKKPRVLF